MSSSTVSSVSLSPTDRQSDGLALKSKHEYWLILVACCLASSAHLLHPPLWVFNPPDVQPFDAAWSEYRLIASLAGVLLIVFLLIGGVLGDLNGRRRVWLIGLSGYIGANLLLMASPNPSWHIAMRFCAVAFSSLFVPLVLATINLTYTERSRTIALSIYTIVNAGTLQLAWVQGQFLFNWLGWRATYVLPILLALLAFHWTKRAVPETHAGKRRQFQILLSSAWTLLILATIYGVTLLPVASDYWLLVVAAASVVGLAGLLLIVWLDVGKASDLLKRRSFRARDLTALIVTGAVINFLLIGFGLRTLGLFQVVRSMSAIVAVIALSPMLIGLVAALYPLLKVKDQFQARTVIASGLLVMAVAMGGIALLPIDAPYLFFALLLLLFGTGYLIASIVWTGSFLRTVIARYYGVNAAITAATSSIGGAIGSALTGKLLEQLGFYLYLQLLTEAQVNVTEALEAIFAFKTLVVSEPSDLAAVTDYLQFDLLVGYREAYAAAYAQILWLMVAFCLVTAVIINFGLRSSLKATMTPPTEEEMSAA